MPLLLRSLALAAVQYGVAEALLRGDGAKRRLGKIVRAAALLLVAAVAASLALAFLLASLFFQLADQAGFIMPSLVTGLVGVAVTVALVWEAARQLRR